MSELALVGIFYDGCDDLWEDFLNLWVRNWPDCPYPLYIVNEEKELHYDAGRPVTVIHAGAGADYSRKVQRALEEIDAEHFLLLLEDFFFTRPLRADSLKKTLKSMSEHGILYLRMNMPELLVGVRRGRYRRDPASGFLRIPTSDEYTVSCQPSIWEKGFLSRCIGTGNYNAWVFEGIYTYSKTAHSAAFLDRCRLDFSNPLGLRHGAVQGKFLPNVLRDIRESGYVLCSRREVLSDEQYRRLLRKQRLKGAIPAPVRAALKKLRGGSVIERYRDEIVSQMKQMGLE